jgi:hypothetical protein
MMGMVRLPVVTTFATALPEREPIKALATAAVLAGPPWVRPAIFDARAMKPGTHERVGYGNKCNRNEAPTGGPASQFQHHQHRNSARKEIERSGRAGAADELR